MGWLRWWWAGLEEEVEVKVYRTFWPGRWVREPLSLRRAPEILSFMVGLRWWWTTCFFRPNMLRRVDVVVVYLVIVLGFDGDQLLGFVIGVGRTAESVVMVWSCYKYAGL